jgi:hypothetical protein
MSLTQAACPIEYRYAAADLHRTRSDRAETAYVIGGLYGNVEALHAILRMQEHEARHGRQVHLVFNGDHNWFDTDAAGFREVNQVALESLAIRGNVEAELAQPSEAGCGCNYPAYVNAEHVARSNAIMRRLQATARDMPQLCAALQALPMFRVIEVGDTRVGIVHGDAESLAGWSFAAERLSPVRTCCSGDEVDDGALTPRATLERWFRDAGVDAYASSHTCLAHARDLEVDSRTRAIFNNGAAGLPNFAAESFGIVTRISIDPAIPRGSLYGLNLNGVRFDAMPVLYDSVAWRERFVANWPPGSPAHEAYFKRIVTGPDFARRDAIGGHVALTMP